MSDVVLIHSPIEWEKRQTPVGDQTSNPPIGLLYIASSLEKGHFSVKVYDPAPQRLTIRDLIDGVHDEKPKVVGIPALIFGTRSAAQIASTI